MRGRPRARIVVTCLVARLRTRKSPMRQLPREHAARLTKAPLEGKVAAAGRDDDCRVGGGAKISYR